MYDNISYLLFLLLLTTCSGFDRIVTSDLNPECESCNSKEISVLYVRGQGESDCLHSIWQISQGPPQLLVGVTPPTGVMHFQWHNDGLTKVISSEPMSFAFGISIDRIWEFNDLNDTGILDPNNKTVSKPFETNEMIWDRVNLVQEESEAMLKCEAYFFGSRGNKRRGKITIKLDNLPFQDYYTDLPHLIHTANSTMVDIIMENLTTSEEFSKPRFALELTFIRTDRTKDSMEIRMRKGLDDEHTPGIFEIIELFTPLSSLNGSGGFMQYRPVAYVKEFKDVTTSTNVHSSEFYDASIPENTTAGLLFDAFNKTKAEKLFISFGSKTSGYYNTTNYNIWSFSMGYGRPPMEGFSLFVIMVISIGIGVPALLAVSGGIYICVKKRQKSRNQPEILVES